MASTKKPKPAAPKTQADLARALNVTRQAVGQWIAAGLPRPPAGKPWDLAAVRRWRRERQEEREATTSEAAVIAAARRNAGLRQAAPATVAEAEEEFAVRVAAGESPKAISIEAVTRFRLAKAKAAEVELARLRGRLIDRHKSEAYVVDLLRGLRAMMLELPRRLDVELAVALEPRECHAIVYRGVCEIMNTVQRQRGFFLPPRCPTCEALDRERLAEWESSPSPAPAERSDSADAETGTR